MSKGLIQIQAHDFNVPSESAAIFGHLHYIVELKVSPGTSDCILLNLIQTPVCL